MGNVCHKRANHNPSFLTWVKCTVQRGGKCEEKHWKTRLLTQLQRTVCELLSSDPRCMWVNLTWNNIPDIFSWTKRVQGRPLGPHMWLWKQNHHENHNTNTASLNLQLKLIRVIWQIKKKKEYTFFQELDQTCCHGLVFKCLPYSIKIFVLQRTGKV